MASQGTRAYYTSVLYKSPNRSSPNQCHPWFRLRYVVHELEHVVNAFGYVVCGGESAVHIHFKTLQSDRQAGRGDRRSSTYRLARTHSTYKRYALTLCQRHKQHTRHSHRATASTATQWRCTGVAPETTSPIVCRPGTGSSYACKR